MEQQWFAQMKVFYSPVNRFVPFVRASHRNHILFCWCRHKDYWSKAEMFSSVLLLLSQCPAAFQSFPAGIWCVAGGKLLKPAGPQPSRTRIRIPFLYWHVLWQWHSQIVLLFNHPKLWRCGLLRDLSFKACSIYILYMYYLALINWRSSDYTVWEEERVWIFVIFFQLLQSSSRVEKLCSSFIFI